MQIEKEAGGGDRTREKEMREGMKQKIDILVKMTTESDHLKCVICAPFYCLKLTPPDFGKFSSGMCSFVWSSAGESWVLSHSALSHNMQ